MTANLLLCAVAGLLEWVLAIWRIRASVAGRKWLAAVLVVTEVMLGLWVFRVFAAGNDVAGVSYALGCGLGTWLGVGNKKSQVQES